MDKNLLEKAISALFDAQDVYGKYCKSKGIENPWYDETFHDYNALIVSLMNMREPTNKEN